DAPRGDLSIGVVRLPPAGGGGDENERGKALAADDGSFRTMALAPGRYRVDATLAAADGRTWIGSAVGTAAEFPATIGLAPSADAPRAWLVRVVDAQGRPVRRAGV